MILPKGYRPIRPTRVIAYCYGPGSVNIIETFYININEDGSIYVPTSASPTGDMLVDIIFKAKEE